MTTEIQNLQITSPEFRDNEMIPTRYTCDGIDINPPILISGIPAETISQVIIMEDPDASKGTFDHWLVWNIEPTTEIKENSEPGMSGKNSAGKTGYAGPCPPQGIHRYIFTIFALNNKLDLPSDTTKDKLLSALKPYVLAVGQLTGKYGKA